MNIERKKKFGAFYTPSEVTDVLSNWTIRSGEDHILEPSFGGCNFLISALTRLKEFGSTNAEGRIYGFDIDPRAFDFVREKKLNGGNFFLEDFLHSSPEDFEFRVSAILGNPPFLPIHKLQAPYKANIFKKFKDFPHKIPGRSSLWIYFIAHSLMYLKVGGRMAWIVPDSISFTEYGKSFLNYLAGNFRFVKVIRINERFFQQAGTKEKTSILICDGYQIGSCTLTSVEVNTLNDGLSEVFVAQPVLEGPLQSNYIPAKAARLHQGFSMKSLRDVFTIRIGIVIGATKLLTYKSKHIETNPYFPNYLYPIITKGKQLDGLSISQEKLLRNQDLPAYLVNGLKLEQDDPSLFLQLLNSIPSKTLLNVTFKSRTNLFGYDDFNHPDAFFTFFSRETPRLILNEGKELNATNSVHRMYLKEPYVNNITIIKWVAIQLLGGLFSSEILDLARQYGDRIRKYEPSDASNIPIIVPESFSEDFCHLVDNHFDRISMLIDNKRTTDAKNEAMTFVQSCAMLN